MNGGRECKKSFQFFSKKPCIRKLKFFFFGKNEILEKDLCENAAIVRLALRFKLSLKRWSVVRSPYQLSTKSRITSDSIYKEFSISNRKNQKLLEWKCHDYQNNNSGYSTTDALSQQPIPQRKASGGTEAFNLLFAQDERAFSPHWRHKNLTSPKVTWTDNDIGRLDAAHCTLAQSRQAWTVRVRIMSKQVTHATQEEPADATRMKAKMKS